MAFDVFVSHSAKDKATADAVCARLEADGIKCWIAPRDVVPGLDWSEAIVNAITHCRVMILIFSSSANTSSQIKREVERAVHKGKIIIPFRIEDIEPTGALEYFISTPHWLDALTPPMEKHINRLLGTVRSLLAGINGDPGLRETGSSAEKGNATDGRQKKSGIAPRLSGGLLAAGAGILVVIAFFFIGRHEERQTEQVFPVASVEVMKNIRTGESGESWARLVTEARRLRALGKTSEALAAFSKYEDLFGEKYPSTKRYVRTAQLFTLQCETLGVAGGAYIHEIFPKGEGAKAGLAEGDIIIKFGNHVVRSTKSYTESRKKMKKVKKVTIEYLRLDSSGHFEKKASTVNYGVLGIALMDI